MRRDDPRLDGVLVLIAHHHGDITVTLRAWLKVGPGPRPRLQPVAAFDASTGARLPLRVIPLRYRNTCLSRLLVRLGVIERPWPPA